MDFSWCKNIVVVVMVAILFPAMLVVFSFSFSVFAQAFVGNGVVGRSGEGNASVTTSKYKAEQRLFTYTV